MNKVRILTYAMWMVCLLAINQILYAEPMNLGLLKTEIRQYHDEGQYQKDLTRVSTEAKRYLLVRVHQNQGLKHKQKLAIVLDIDETCLSSYDFIEKSDFAYHRDDWKRHLLSADAAAIEPMLSLYHLAQTHDVAIFFVTGRGDTFKKATERNLIQAGFHHWAGLYTRPEHYRYPSIVPFKAHARATITKHGYTIIESIGDQTSDLKGGYAEKTYKLPNPYYFIP